MADGENGAERADGAEAPAPWWPRLLASLVTPVWLAMFALAAAAAFGSAWVTVSGRASNLVQVEFGFMSGGAANVPLSDEAKASGLRIGDQITTADGIALGFEQARGVAEGATMLFIARSPDGTETRHVLTRRHERIGQYYAAAGVSPAFDKWFRLVAQLTASLVLLAAAGLLFWRGQRKRVPTLLSFTFMALSLTVTNREPFAYFGLLSRNLGLVAPTVALLIITLMLFPDGRFAFRWNRWLAWFQIAALPVVMVVGPAGAGFMRYWIPLDTALVVCAAASLALKYRKLPNGEERQQVRWALFGLVTGTIAFLPSMLNGTGAAMLGWTPGVVYWASFTGVASSSLALVLYAGGLLVSQLKYRLYDADAVISRSVSFGALALVLVAVFAGAERVIELLGEQWFGHSLGVLAGGIGAAIAAAMILPLHHRLTHWAEHKFQKELIRLRTGLPLLVGDMRETAPVKRIAAAALDSISHGVRAVRAALVFDGELLDARGIEGKEVEDWLSGWSPPHHQGLDIHRADTTFPLRVPLAADGHGRIGWLLMGPRPDGSFYGKDERETLTHIADPVARALEIAHEREDRDAAERTRWQSQEELNAEQRNVNAELLRVLGSLDRKLDHFVSTAAAAKASAGS